MLVSEAMPSGRRPRLCPLRPAWQPAQPYTTSADLRRPHVGVPTDANVCVTASVQGGAVPVLVSTALSTIICTYHGPLAHMHHAAGAPISRSDPPYGKTRRLGPHKPHAMSAYVFNNAITITTDPHAPVPAVISKHIGGSTANQPAASVPQQLLWQRMGFPSIEAWRYLTTVTTNHGQPPNLPLSSTLLANDAVMRGRARARPFISVPDTADSLPPPGAVWYMDHTGTMLPSHPHRFIGYFGIVDRGSGYARTFPTHSFNAAQAALA
jgi:hypothetical protein